MLIESALLPILIQGSFRLSGVPRTQARLRQWAELHRFSPADRPEQVIRRACSAQRAAQKLARGGTCLVRSLALWTSLRRRGINVDLQVGFRKHDGKLEGHAWIEYQGNAVNDNPELICTYTSHKELPAFDADLWCS